MTLTYYGHSCFSIDHQGTKILFDPFIRPNPLAKNVDVGQIEADYILVSHGHFDHIADLVEIAKRTGAKVVCNYEIYTWLGKQGVENAHPVNHGGAVSFPFGKVKYVNAVHSSGLDDGTYLGNAGGFVIQFAEKAIYYAGDTALTMDMQLIGRQFDVDLALLPIGDNFTMGVEDAVIACEFVGTQKVVGMHYDTFPPIAIDKNEATTKFKEAGVELVLMNIEETIDI